MNLSKSYEFFHPEECRERIHIIGCGAIGSTLAENLARFGLTKITLYDFDTVDAHNIANQMFSEKDIGRLKVEALSEMLQAINPQIVEDLKIVSKGYVGQRMSGYVFLCVDNIELRKEITKSLADNSFIRAVFDFRMRLTDAQHYAAAWDDRKMVTDLLNSMDFTHEEAQQATPVSACNMTLSVVPTVRMIVAAGVSNFINYVKGRQIKKMILVDAFQFTMDAF